MVFKIIISFNCGLYRFYPVLPMGKTDCFTQFYPILPNWFYPLGKCTCQPWLHVMLCYVRIHGIKVTQSRHLSTFLAYFLNYWQPLCSTNEKQKLRDSWATFHQCWCHIFRMKPSDLRSDHWWRKTRTTGLSDGERILTMCSAILIQYTRVTDGRIWRGIYAL